MQLLINWLVLLISFLYNCCIEQNKTKTGMVDLLSPSEFRIEKISDIASDIDYIPLRSSGASPIGYIQDIKTNSDKFYLLTQNISQSVIYCFNKAGQYLYKLDSNGRGPEEFQNISDFDISSDDKYLIILNVGKIFIYNNSSEGFVFSKSLKLDRLLSKIDFIPKTYNILCSYHSADGIETFRNLLISINGDTLNSRKNYNKYNKNGGGIFYLGIENINFNYNNTLQFSDLFSDTVFTVDRSNSFRPYLIFYSYGKRPTAGARADATTFHINFQNYIIVDNIMETSRFLVYYFTYSNTIQYDIYDKVLGKKSKTILKSAKKLKWLKDDIAGGPEFEIKYCSNEKLFHWVDAFQLKKLVSNESFNISNVKKPEKKQSLEKLANTLDDNDNPVLIIVTLKK